MTSENSLIIEYYPHDFKTDLNGKQQEWEAVVLIPFIDEVRPPRPPQLTVRKERSSAVSEYVVCSLNRGAY